MRILHTSDWHLGRQFHGTNLLAEQGEFLDQLIDYVLQHKIDVLLVCGDVYDRAIPPIQAITLLNDALARLSSAGVYTVITSGKPRLSYAAGLWQANVLQGWGALSDRFVHAVPLEFQISGSMPVRIYPLNYIEPRLASEQLHLSSDSHHEAVKAALKKLRTTPVQVVTPQGSEPTNGECLEIVMAHVFAAGGHSEDSERTLSVGGLDTVALSLFEEFDYAALGHLHSRQKLGERSYYCGSPLPYSFSEAGREKGAWLITVDEHGIQDVSAVDFPTSFSLARIRGTLEHILTDESFSYAHESYVQITLTDDERPERAMERVRTRFANTLQLRHEPANPRVKEVSSYQTRIASARDEQEVVSRFFSHVRDRELSQAERKEITEAIQAVKRAHTSA